MRHGLVGLLLSGLMLVGCADAEVDSGGVTTSPEEALDETPHLSPTPGETPGGGDDGEAADGQGLTGFGANREAWNANHEQAPGYTEGAAYLPIVGEDQPKYAAVCCDERIITYMMFMDESTSLDDAEVMIAAELPSDASAGRLIEKDGGCTMQLWESSTLQDATGSNVVVSYDRGDGWLTAIFGQGDSTDELTC